MVNAVVGSEPPIMFSWPGLATCWIFLRQTELDLRCGNFPAILAYSIRNVLILCTKTGMDKNWIENYLSCYAANKVNTKRPGAIQGGIENKKPIWCRRCVDEKKH